MDHHLLLGSKSLSLCISWFIHYPLGDLDSLVGLHLLLNPHRRSSLRLLSPLSLFKVIFSTLFSFYYNNYKINRNVSKSLSIVNEIVQEAR
jgi:hypothetical protein